MPYGLVTVDGRPLTGPGGIWLAGDVVAAPVVSAYDIDETIEPYRSMSNENISGSFADVVNAYENGPNVASTPGPARPTQPTPRGRPSRSG
jgi:hypothetical protein